ncbi:ribonuclease HII [Rubritalea marina]|uniref:ribonuclease HII n=1 Tax=Rubritalea marina TaxID=361055 RepID=UPI000374F2AD|nr:ribonuclease HII [Rubritalea marina]
MPDYSFEESAWQRGHDLVIGIDEAGRGPLAGPVSAAAVLLPDGFSHPLLDDSKKLSEKKREQIYADLMADDGIRWGHAYVEAEEIDSINILKATHLAMARAVEGIGLDLSPYCLIDGLAVPQFPYESEGIVKGDSKSMSIAAASIIAKVKRDRAMVKYAEQYPGYGFERHKGYGTKVHLEALRSLGPCPIHRLSFAPVAQLELL